MNGDIQDSRKRSKGVSAGDAVGLQRPISSKQSLSSSKKYKKKLATGIQYVQKHKLKSSIIFACVLILIGAIAWYIIHSALGDTNKTSNNPVVARYQGELPGLKKAVNDNPGDATARKNYAIALYATGDMQGAQKQYEEAIKLNSKDAVAYNNLGNVYRDNKNFDKAIEAYNKAIELNKISINPYINLANVQLYVKGDADAAIETYKRGLQALPGNEQLSLLLGIAYEQADRKDDAMRTYRDILAKHEDNAAAKANLERLEK